jgi:hypothetical protein
VDADVLECSALGEINPHKNDRTLGFFSEQFWRLKMSNDHFHVHHLEHAAKHGADDSFQSRIAVTTAIVATVGSIFSYMGGVTMSNAILYKNNAAIRKTEASNQWSYFQSKGSKQNLAELGFILTEGAKKKTFSEDVERYKTEKEAIKIKSEKLEKESEAWDEKSEQELHQHHRWAQATTVLQVAIALAAISLLTRKRWLTQGVFGLAGLGVLLGFAALLHW